MGSIRERKSKDGIRYHLSVRKKGYPKVSKVFNTREEAEKFEKMYLSSYESVCPKLPLSVWIKRYEEEAKDIPYFTKYIYLIKVWSAYLGNEIAINITATQIETWISEIAKSKNRLGRSYSQETLRKFLVALGSLYNRAIREWKWAHFNPVRDVKKKVRESAGFSKNRGRSYPDELSFCYEVLEKIKGEADFVELRAKTNLSKNTLYSIYKDKRIPSLPIFLRLLKGMGYRMEIKQKMERR